MQICNLNHFIYTVFPNESSYFYIDCVLPISYWLLVGFHQAQMLYFEMIANGETKYFEVLFESNPLQNIMDSSLVHAALFYQISWKSGW